MSSLRLRRESIHSETALELIRALNAELSQQYPEPGANHFRLDSDEVGSGRGVFLVAYWQNRPVGCGALRRLDPNTGELKRMFISPRWRGRGFGRRLLGALEEEARALGVVRLVLETGTRQAEAVALYERAGFQRIPSFGEYAHSPLSVCMAKRLS